MKKVMLPGRNVLTVRRFLSPLSNYILVRNSRPKPSSSITTEEIADSEDAIGELSSLFDEQTDPWILGGGMAIAIHAGAYHRTHYDLDILVEAREFASLISSAEQKGYLLCQRIFSQRISTNLTIQLVRSVDAHQARKSGYGRLQLIKLDAHNSSASDLMNVIDVCVFYRIDGLITRHDGKISLPEAEFYCLRHVTKSGRVVNVVSLEYLNAVKSRRHGSIDRLDLRVIRELQSRSPMTESAGVH